MAATVHDRDHHDSLFLDGVDDAERKAVHPLSSKTASNCGRSQWVPPNEVERSVDFCGELAAQTWLLLIVILGVLAELRFRFLPEENGPHRSSARMAARTSSAGVRGDVPSRTARYRRSISSSQSLSCSGSGSSPSSRLKRMRWASSARLSSGSLSTSVSNSSTVMGNLLSETFYSQRAGSQNLLRPDPQIRPQLLVLEHRLGCGLAAEEREDDPHQEGGGHRDDRGVFQRERRRGVAEDVDPDGRADDDQEDGEERSGQDRADCA